ncbi:BZ3500_MvSof-1268-A1-R1_Chr1-1g01204 [Microbotryum saponariae]|uniref:Enhancer of mRNA-decapping protein 3 n=1 Tax=Microbotryum saponariae TaxID=289078 RepID=A0A2X0ME33_9BASI|nr:BZ3500_MvSof-1268-A1-R1_Chr1-1g01204 [Microbotryum saponariae]SCZ93656.1 BZ3501_MvSof-1269-A2-R1_Chr1-1g00800 [Microbotryum saponariae]
MASSFVGLPVRCNLRNGKIITGLVAGVDAVRGTITIESSSSGAHYDLPRAQVVNLELLSLAKQAQGEGVGAKGGGRKSRGGEEGVQGSKEGVSSLGGGVEDKVSRRAAQSTTPAHEVGESKRSTSVAQHVTKPQPSNISEDFDFGAGLDQFDKQREFAAIKSQDRTDPALRLVSHNKQTKLLPNENVLSVAELEQQTQQLAQSLARLDPGRTTQVNTTKKMKEGGVLRTKRGVIAPCLTRGQYREVVSIAEIETGPTSLQRTEAGSRALGQLILSFQPDSNAASTPSSLCILCGSKAIEKSTLALRAGTMLVNRGYRVVAYVASMEGVAEAALRGFSAAGGRLGRNVADLPNDFDLVLDAIADEQDQITEIPAQDLTILRWTTTRNQAPIIAIDTPSGGEGRSKISFRTSFPKAIELTVATPPTKLGALVPAYTLHRTALRTPTSSNTQHVILDEGISPKLLRRLGGLVSDEVEGLFGKNLFVEVS